MYNIKEYTALIRERLSDYRFYHSLCVAESAKALAKRYGADEEKAQTAGILHDIMKENTKAEQLEIIEKAGMTITPLEKSKKKFYHQISGAAYAKAMLGIEDTEILDAIRYHTTGRENMSLMEQIVYLAD
ncbi:MAG: bis(5'-nucleosyl)-tetraphosphatase (symmetrical) YqeK, partial [Eubacterium sp.]